MQVTIRHAFRTDGVVGIVGEQAEHENLAPASPGLRDSSLRRGNGCRIPVQEPKAIE